MNHFDKTLLLLALWFVTSSSFAPHYLLAQTNDTTPDKPGVAESDSGNQKPEKQVDPETKKLHDKFQANLTNTKFIGQFTITGMESEKPRQEEYTITKVKKLPKDDLWEITARIKYGDHDLTVPMVMAVKWAGKTPVITVDRLFVPGLGTFDSRVLLRKDKYAGTWAHGTVGGHLFGRIEKIEKTETPSEK